VVTHVARAGSGCITLPAMSDAEPQAVTTHPDATILARWEQLGRPPIPIAFNDRGLVWKTIVDLAVYLAIPQDAEERRRAVAWVVGEQRV
jgi:hypothetical protein